MPGLGPKTPDLPNAKGPASSVGFLSPLGFVLDWFFVPVVESFSDWMKKNQGEKKKSSLLGLRRGRE